MKAKRIIIAVLFLLVSAFIVFYAFNLALADLPSIAYGFIGVLNLSTIPAFAFALDLVLVVTASVRLQREGQYKKHWLTKANVLLCVFSSVGLIGAVLTGTVVYGTFLSPYPFPGYTVIALAVHLLLLALSVFGFIRLKKMPADAEKKKMGPAHVVNTVFMAFVFFALERFGALVWSPVYVQWRTLDVTFPFYLSLIAPMAFLIAKILLGTAALKNKPRAQYVTFGALFVFNLLTSGAVVFVCTRNPLFLAATSPALGLDRLATAPIVSTVHFCLMTALCLHQLLLVYFGQKSLTKGRDKP